MWACASDGQLVGIGALKRPGLGYRNRVFAEAQATTPSDEYHVELGWVVVVKSHQGQRLSTRIVGELLAFAKNENVFATTRADKRAMRLASECGFKLNGKPYPSGRGYDLVLYLHNAARFPDAEEQTHASRQQRII
jgi:GNAT superfamily N-acetyltransferase